MQLVMELQIRFLFEGHFPLFLTKSELHKQKVNKNSGLALSPVYFLLLNFGSSPLQGRADSGNHLGNPGNHPPYLIFVMRYKQQLLILFPPEDSSPQLQWNHADISGGVFF